MFPARPVTRVLDAWRPKPTLIRGGKKHHDTMKRGRLDGGISKEDYERSEASLGTNGNSFGSGFDRASSDVINTRRIAAVGASSPLEATHFTALNDAFVATLTSQWAHNKHGDWTENMREYINYARDVTAKFGGRSGQLLTFGSGDCGQLGHGVDEDDDLMVKFPRIVALLQSQKITRVMCGGLHSAAITSDGHVYTWGCNDDGALGRDGDENLPARVEGFGPSRRAVLAVGGDSHTAVMTASGHVYTWGAYKDKEGKMWCDSAAPSSSFKQKQPKPFLIKGLSHVVDLKCGSSFNVVRTSQGHVYSWGLGEMGQLARPVDAQIRDDKDEYKVDMVHREHLAAKRVALGSEELPPVKAIGCGSYHTLVVLSANGYLYSCGLNNYGQLGIGSDKNCDVLQLVDDLTDKNIAAAEGGTHHSIVLTNDGEVYAFGRADSGQLGMLDVCQTGDFKDRPQKVTFNPSGVTIQNIASGSNHTLALTEDNHIYSWGYGDMLALGHGDEQDENRPRRLNWTKTKFGDAQILQIDAGGQHSAILAAKKSAP
jgi:regulator of chromosome condensation